MNNREIRTRLKNEFNSVVPDTLDGRPVYISKPGKSFFHKKALAFSCALAFAFVLGIGFSNVYYHVYASISIDINPSVSIDINRFDLVVNVSAHNAEARRLISDLKLKNVSIDNAVEQILSEAQSEGYIIDESSDNAILLSVWSDDADEAEKLENSIQVRVENCVNLKNVNSEIRFENVDTDTYHHARSMNMSSGKIKLVDNIMQYDDSFDENDLLSKPVNELFGVYDHCKSAHPQINRGRGNPNNTDNSNNIDKEYTENDTRGGHGHNGGHGKKHE